MHFVAYTSHHIICAKQQSEYEMSFTNFSFFYFIFSCTYYNIHRAIEYGVSHRKQSPPEPPVPHAITVSQPPYHQNTTYNPFSIWYTHTHCALDKNKPSHNIPSCLRTSSHTHTHKPINLQLRRSRYHQVNVKAGRISCKVSKRLRYQLHLSH